MALMSSRPEYGGGEQAGAMWGMAAGRDVASAALAVDGTLGEGDRYDKGREEMTGVEGK
jgi:hypothetical protein